jgi:hypothetical protein
LLFASTKYKSIATWSSSYANGVCTLAQDSNFPINWRTQATSFIEFYSHEHAWISNERRASIPEIGPGAARRSENRSAPRLEITRPSLMMDGCPLLLKALQVLTSQVIQYKA